MNTATEIPTARLLVNIGVFQAGWALLLPLLLVLARRLHV